MTTDVYELMPELLRALAADGKLDTYEDADGTRRYRANEETMAFAEFLESLIQKYAPETHESKALLARVREWVEQYGPTPKRKGT